MISALRGRCPRPLDECGMTRAAGAAPVAEDTNWPPGSATATLVAWHGAVTRPSSCDRSLAPGIGTPASPCRGPPMLLPFVHRALRPFAHRTPSLNATRSIAAISASPERCAVRMARGGCLAKRPGHHAISRAHEGPAVRPPERPAFGGSTRAGVVAPAGRGPVIVPGRRSRRLNGRPGGRSTPAARAARARERLGRVSGSGAWAALDRRARARGRPGRVSGSGAWAALDRRARAASPTDDWTRGRCAASRQPAGSSARPAPGRNASGLRTARTARSASRPAARRPARGSGCRGLPR